LSVATLMSTVQVRPALSLNCRILASVGTLCRLHSG
jgi:hypothetical protein